ncbi:unnamed protein product [Leptosia nina]|uniref:Farnesoic acid O-methyl transferase domain-containing protein n=1 Tax=Leptosia nina TaxID=320188 RepID=A0AAV1J950_9NEOP
MSDIVEITTLPAHRNIFYKITGNGLIFLVKSGNRSDVAIGLSKQLHRTCNYWIYIEDGHTWIKCSEQDRYRYNAQYTPNLLSDTEFTKFWLNWDSRGLFLGKVGDPTPIVSEKDVNCADIKYITFSGCETRVNWKFNLPPQIHRPALRELSTGQPQWVKATDQLPDGSFIGGYENEFLYIIRSPHRGSLTPGKFVPSLGLGFISWGGSSHEKSEFEVLCGIDCQWVPANGESIPVTAVEAGYSEGHDSGPLYVGRAKHEGHIIPGKVQPTHKVCYIPYDDREIAKSEYEVLVLPFSNKHAENRVFATIAHGEIADENTDAESVDL